MASRAAGKVSRPAAKGTIKTPGKEQTKGEKAPANVLEIVPGKFNENDWLALLENDETEDFIADIFDDIWKETSKQIQQIYIRRQLLPFTLMMTENALSSVIQWAFLERDRPKPTDGDFCTEDDEPIPCSMDNWGEGVVPACREEHPQDIEELSAAVAERPPSAPLQMRTPDEEDEMQRSSTSSSAKSSTDYDIQSKQAQKSTNFDQGQSTKSGTDTYPSFRKEPSIQQKPHKHDILVIQTQPPKLEPLSGLFHPKQIRANGSTSQTTPATITARRRRMIAPKASSQLGSDAMVSTANTTNVTKSTKKVESKLFDEQHIEEAISKAPAAAQSILKSILSRPPGYRELELDDYGNVISIARIDPDKLAPRSVRVKCDIVKPRRSMAESRSLTRQAPSTKLSRSEPKFSPIKLVLPEKSTAVGDLIQPVPGVLYEDAKLKKGDPRRYKNGMSKYTGFYDDSRPLKPIGRRSDFAMLQSTTELLRKTTDYNHDNGNERDPQIPILHRFGRIPPIMSPSNTSSA